MYIENIKLSNYRNYDDEFIEFNNKINIIYGNNAQGKTNLIEAIYLCATSKSHRFSFDKELIKIGEKEGNIHLSFNKNDISESIHIQLNKNNKKKIAINKIELKKISDLFGSIHVIIFSPEDLGLIKKGPKERRRFIDFELSQLNPIYMYYLSHYYKVLKQRNKLMKTNNKKTDEEVLIDVWDLELIKYGIKVIEMRKKFIDELKPIIRKKHYFLSGKKEKISIKYNQNTTIKNYKNELKVNRYKDKIKGTTSVGPHRDDIDFIIDNMNIKKYGSQGQQRTAALALKLAEIDLVKKKIEDTPILLLDDVLSELDSNRQKYLMNHIKEIQTFITCTELDNFKEIEKKKDISFYKIKNGELIIPNK